MLKTNTKESQGKIMKSNVRKALLSSFLVFAMLIPLASCVSTSDDNKTEETTAETTAAITTSTTHADDKPSTPENTYEPLTAPVPKSLKILAIGNSFSTDAMAYLFQIARVAGVEKVILGNLYYSGCSLDQHFAFGTNDSASYTYYKKTTGDWIANENYKMSDAIKDEDWDYISLQQTSKTCGLPNSYSKLDNIISIVRKYNTTAKLAWNMTWAYQQDSTHSSFPNYNNNQMTMYNMIISTTKECIEPRAFDLIIPCGTAIQNARTSFMGDTLTRDGYHLDYQIGRYIASLTYFAAITDSPIDGISYNPSPLKINTDMLLAAKESVKNSILKPYEVTASTYTEGTRPGTGGGSSSGGDNSEPPSTNAAGFIPIDTTLAASYGIDLSGYTQLEWGYIENAYWYCTKKADTTTPGSSASTYQQNICSDKKYSLEELPVGTIFILDSGWQYRLEIYTSENAKYTGTRPSMSTDEIFVLTDEFIGDCNYIAWNISSNPKTNISSKYAEAAYRLRIYIPNTTQS